jgi:5-methylcytosine-specific restriction enzyme subunit McrC
MNRFFQALLKRFLCDYLSGYRVEDEFKLFGLMRYHPEHNPLNRRSPLPRPDYIIFQGQQALSILDAKYRDLWNTALPSSMLYQLSVYALSQRTASACATILYPTITAGTREQQIEIRDPVSGDYRAKVVLRSVDLLHMGRLIEQGLRDVDENARFAYRLAFGG